MQANSERRRGWKIMAATSALVFATTLGVTIARGGDVASANAGQPRMESAKEHLRAARGLLDKAEHNKGGHREEAKRLTDAAIHEVESGINSAE